ncbi:MAG: methylated-DNA--[protein]-cysteine S-methyltransferase [Myxococcota bacterium]
MVESTVEDTVKSGRGRGGRPADASRERRPGAEVAPLRGQALLSLDLSGPLLVAWSADGLRSLRWAAGAEPLAEVPLRKRVPASIARPLRAFDRGDPLDLAAEVPVDLGDAGTPFQRQVWAALRRIRRGRLRTYAGVAADIGRPRAMRAVGRANGANPVPLVIPCHRVVGAGLTLGGYAGGLERKRRLLAREGVKLRGDRLHPGQLALFD